MKVLLMDLDVDPRRRPFPNLALMKLSRYHKKRGDQVDLNFPLVQADLIYASCVFTWHWDNKKRAVLPPGAVIGGSGVKLQQKLPDHIERLKPDYSLYPGITFSLGFTSRGCVNRCPWCIVPQKEGNIRAAGRIYDFWDKKHRLIMLLDNNLLSAPNWRQTLEDLASEDVYVDFNQGLDIRLITDDVVTLLTRLQFKKLRFAFDSLAMEPQVRAGVKLLTDAGIRSRQLSFYVLYGYMGDRTAVKRLKILEELNVDVYPMAYRGPDGKEPQRVLENIPAKFFHGSRANVKKMLRLKGRLPA